MCFDRSKHVSDDRGTPHGRSQRSRHTIKFGRALLGRQNRVQCDRYKRLLGLSRTYVTRFDTIFEQRQLAHATTIENVAHVWVQAQTSHRWQMEAYEPTSDHITAISNTVGLANPTIVSNSKRQLLAVTLRGPMSTGYDPISLHRATHCHDQSSCKLLI